MRWWVGVVVGVVLSCGDGAARTTVRMELEAVAEGDFYAMPLPDAARGYGLAGFPTTGAAFIEDLLDLLEDAEGASTTGAIHFTTTAPLDFAPLDVHASVEANAPVMLWRLDGPELAPHPIEVRFFEDGGPFGAPNMLSLLPLPGRPLAPGARYAAVVRGSVADQDGRALGPAPALREARYQDALALLAAQDVNDVVGMALFETQDPTGPMRALREAALAEPRPAPTAFAHLETHSNFCVYEARIEMPTYQDGEPPFSSEGGRIRFDDAGVPLRTGSEEARFFVTIPRAPMPAAGYPLVVMSRTGGGGDRPLIDRGVRDASGEPIEEGSGPAREFAAVGWAGASIDGPLGGPLRNPAGSDEQLLIFNFNNPPAMLDNVRQSAVELVLAAHVAPELRIDASACEGATADARFDVTQLTLLGHSMGATIAPLTLAVEPRYRAAILSGAGGSWGENVIYKESPLAVRPIAELLLRVPTRYELHSHDPSLTLLQWAGESADPPVFGEAIRANGTHVLMLQGIVDTYILPPMANATSLALGLDLAGPALDAADERLADYASLDGLLAFGPGAHVEHPAGPQADGVTRLVTQHLEDGVEDGHEVAFQLDVPKAQYRCFLASLVDGAPVVPAGTAGCP